MQIKENRDVKEMSPAAIRREHQRRDALAMLESIPCELIQEVIQIGLGDWAEGPVLLHKLSHCRFFAFEPVDRYIEAVKKDGFPGKIYRKIVWDKDGEFITFGDRRTQSSVFCDDNIKGLSSITEETITLDTWAKDLLVPLRGSLLWMDCEGAERHVLKGAEEMIKSVKYVICEHRDDPKFEGWAKSKDLIEDLKELGFHHKLQVGKDGVFVR